VTAPFTDSAAIFLVPFASLAMALVERGWKRRLTTLAAVFAIAVTAVSVANAFTAELPGVSRSLWTALVNADVRALSGVNPIEPFLRQQGTGPYLLYEFTPKMFLGFSGWLGQPSILLPAVFFAGVVVVLIAGLTGLVARVCRSGE